MLKLFRSKTFLKEYRNIKFTDKLYLKYIMFVTTLLREEILPVEALDHSLKGQYHYYRSPIRIYQTDRRRVIMPRTIFPKEVLKIKFKKI
jgi:mRNA-degrading endonuclease YafQ of YafQ-DinJ toxin-antitoxin module